MAKEKDLSPKKLSPFDFINNINAGPSAGNLLEGCTADDSESTPMDNPSKQYVPFIINRSLSYFNDTVLFANEMNRHHSLPPKMQYDFYRHAMRPRKRFSKWAKRLMTALTLQYFSNTIVIMPLLRVKHIVY